MTFWAFIFRYWWIGLPIVLLGVVFAVAMAHVMVQLIRALVNLVHRLMFPTPQGQLLCPVCGYDIRYSPHRCPECGTKLMWGLLPTARDLKRGNPRWR